MSSEGSDGLMTPTGKISQKELWSRLTVFGLFIGYW